MKQIIPFEHLIEFKTNLASITSISLEHEEQIKKGEVSGDFIVYGNYKEHSDTTEEELFKYRIPYTAIIPDDISLDTVSIDINNFTYEVIENKSLKVNIDFTLIGESMVVVDEDRTFEIDNDNKIEIEEVKEEKEQEVTEIPQIFEKVNTLNRTKEENNPLEIDEIQEYEETQETTEVQETKENNEKNKVEIEEKEEAETIDEEFITYYIHVVAENETLEQIIKKYETTLDNVKEYNDITNIKIGDKIIIPQILND